MRIVVSNSSPEPIYEQISRQIRRQIIASEVVEGDPLPSIRVLAKELQVSVITTKRAYEELERQGLIDSVGGKGTFVAAQNKEFLREKQFSAVEEQLSGAVDQAQIWGIAEEQLHEMVTLLYQEDGNERA
ncbi:MAG: GntR family transcriptional regulator [Spirochaetaceae bacterium]|nr:GntR family transcriptional regulator [Spirochaetaceae bacterium]